MMVALNSIISSTRLVCKSMFNIFFSFIHALTSNTKPQLNETFLVKYVENYRLPYIYYLSQHFCCLKEQCPEVKYMLTRKTQRSHQLSLGSNLQYFLRTTQVKIVIRLNRGIHSPSNSAMAIIQ